MTDTPEEKLKKAFEDSMDECFEDFDDQYEHELVETWVPYGDTQVKMCEYPTERSQLRCSEAFQQDFDVFKFMEEYLMENKEFIEAIKEYVKFHY